VPYVRHVLMGASLFLSVVRVLVLFSESWASVRAERAGDAELLRICQAQTLASSDKFRQACLSARADSAAPLVLKTLTKSMNTAFTDFTEAFNTPTRVFFLLLFLLSGISAPVVRGVLATVIRAATARDAPDISDDGDSRVVIVPQADMFVPKRRRRWHMLTDSEVVPEASAYEASLSDQDEEAIYANGWSPIACASSVRSRRPHNQAMIIE